MVYRRLVLVLSVLLLVGLRVGPLQSQEPSRDEPLSGTFSLLDEAGNRERTAVQLTVLTVDLDHERLEVREGSAPAFWVTFDQVDPGDLMPFLIDYVDAHVQSLGDADAEGRRIWALRYLQLAGLAVRYDQIRRARRLVREATETSDQVAEDATPVDRLVTELLADDELGSARAYIAEERSSQAERILDDLVDHYPETAAARDARDLLQQLREQGGDEASQSGASTSPPSPSPVDAVEDRRERDLLPAILEGHRIIGESGQNSRASVAWRDALALAEELEATAKELLRTVPPDRMRDRDRLEALLEALAEDRLALCKNLGHYYLLAFAFPQAETYIDRGLAIDPQDREILLLRLMLDEYRIPVMQARNQQTQEQDPEDESGEDDTDDDGDDDGSGG